LAIGAANLAEYTIIIQQDIDSIPEAQGLIAILAIGCAGALLALLKRYNKGDIL